MIPDENEIKETPILNLIQNIQSGVVDPRGLSKEERQQCIEVLYLEGYSVSELAQILNRNERTVKRDLDEIRRRTAIAPNAELAKQFVGEMVAVARLRQGRLERLAKTKDATVLEKGQAEYLAWKVQKEMIEKLQSLGYLPLKPQEIVGDIFHHTDGDSPIKSFDEITAIITEVQTVAQKTGQFDPQIVKEIEDLNAQLEKARLTHRADELLKKQTELTQGEQNEK